MIDKEISINGGGRNIFIFVMKSEIISYFLDMLGKWYICNFNFYYSNCKTDI